MRVSEYLFKTLEEEGINQVFAVIGTVSIWLFKALQNNRNIKAIFNNHEQAAAMAADGWGRIKGKPGVVITTNGPGVTNALTGIAQAWVDSAPVVFVCGNSKQQCIQVESETGMRQYGAQDVPTEALMKQNTKKFFRLEKAQHIKKVISEALYLSMEGRPGPVCIEIPLNLQNAEIMDKMENVSIEPRDQIHALSSLSKSIIDKIQTFKRPLIIAGQGVRLSKKVEEFNCFIKNTGIPVVTSRMGNDIICSDNELFVGRPGGYGNRASHFAIQSCDLLLIMGSRLSLNTTGFEPAKFASQAYKIMIDVDPKELHKPDIKINESYCVDLNALLPLLQEDSINKKIVNSKWTALCRAWYSDYSVYDKKYDSEIPMNTYAAVKAVSECAKEGDVVLSDTGTCCNIVGQIWEVKNNQRLLISGGLSCMGYWATSIGCSTATDKNTICIVGDGSLQMNIQEFGTIARNNLNIKIFVVNNNGYQIIKIGEKNYGIETPIAVNPASGLGFANLENIAKAYNLPYIRITEQLEIQKNYEYIFLKKGPVICELMVGEDQITLPKLKSKANPDGSFVSPNYEDLFPFLDEEILKQELQKAQEI